MGKFEGITLISDIDGTLFSSPGTIPRANVEATEYFMENGGRFAVATGRSQVSIAKNFDKFRVNTPCIVLNGTGLYDYSMEDFILKRICNDRLRKVTAQTHAKFPGLTCYVFTGERIYTPGRGEYQAQVEAIEVMKSRIADFSEMDPYWLKSIFYAAPEQLKQVQAYVDELNDGSFDTVFSADKIFELMPKGANKGTMIHEYAKIMDVPVGNICAIGDYYNDREMLAAAGFTAAPAGAPDEIKALVDVQVCDCRDGAVADFIRVIEQNLDRFQRKNVVS